MHQNSIESQSRNFKIYATLLLGTLVLTGAYFASSMAPFIFGFGDHGLFHAFGHWIVNGEVFMRDFIHFRTPGPYYYFALFQKILGGEFLSTATALLCETYIFQVAAGFILAIAASKVFWNKASLTLAFCTGVIFLFVPPIFQLRTALPAMALAMYLFALVESQSQRKNLFLLLTGLCLGQSYWFGQEIFIFLCISIFAAEISVGKQKTVKQIAWRMLVLAIGIAVSVAPGLLYFWINGVDLTEYFYYTFYYAFILQPKGMDLPFPWASSTGLGFYIWISILIGSILILTYRGRLLHPASIVFVSYSCLRMISALGRADVLHLWFSISEIFVLFPIALGLLFWPALNYKSGCDAHIWTISLQRSQLSFKRAKITFAVAFFLIILFLIAMNGHSSALIVVPAFLIGLKYWDQFSNRGSNTNGLPEHVTPITDRKAVISSLVACAAVFIFTYPNSLNQLRFARDAGSRTILDPVLGVQFPDDGVAEMKLVRGFLEERKAKDIFSYPIRSEYYAFVPKHGTRIVSFEPQTTQNEVFNTVAELAKSRPSVVIRDLDQVAEFSRNLTPISDYISSHYRSVLITNGMHKLELMEINESQMPTRRLFDHAYEFNDAKKDVFAGMRSKPDNSRVLVIAIMQNEGVFRFSPGKEDTFVVKIYPESGNSDIGEIEIIQGNSSYLQRINFQEGSVNVPLPTGSGDIEIRLRSADKNKSILWEDPKITQLN